MSTDTEERTVELEAKVAPGAGDGDGEIETTTGESAIADDADDSEPGEEPGERVEQRKSGTKGRRVSVSIRTLLVSAAVVALVAAVGVLSWLYLDTKAQLDRQAVLAANVKHAEEIALNYAVNAAVMDCKDLGPWKQNLVKGTTPELGDKLTKAATSMEQILLPLQWSSTAKPLAAKVRSHDNGVYVIDAFVSVMTKTIQATDSLQSTATYSITIDSNNAWKITDVGGIAAVVADK